jgi:hypothetical protein
MATLSGEQVVALADSVGLPRTQLITATAIAWAESGLRTDAIGYNRDPDTHVVISRDRGLWQINDYWHPDVSDTCAFDPFCNAQAMGRISSNGSNWSPWSTYNNGAYTRYTQAATLAYAAWLTRVTGPGAQLPPQTVAWRTPILNFIYRTNQGYWTRADVVNAQRANDWDSVAGEWIDEVATAFWLRPDVAGEWNAGRHENVFGEFVKEGGLTGALNNPVGGTVLPPSPTDDSQQIVNDINAGRGPVAVTARMLQRIVDETMDQKYGPGHRTGPIFGGIIQ